MGYFDNGVLNKYEKIEKKIEFFFIDVFFYL
jgi:hypothetical protein